MEKFPLEGLVEAVALINSRTTRVTEDVSFLVPLADMFNHRPEAQVEAYFDPERCGYVVKALVDIPEGAEICTNYGMEKSFSNYDLFMSYGFLYQPDETNEIQLALMLDENDPEYREKVSKLEPAYRI